jgi:endoglucanase
MTKRSIGSQPRREFSKLAALTRVAVFAINESVAETISTGDFQASAIAHKERKMNFLRVNGRDIVDSEGKKVQLRGTWMNMEDFINGHPGAEHTLRAQMAEVLGASKAQFFFDRMLDYFFNEDDVIFLRKAGANVRFPLNYRHFEDDLAPFKYKESGFARLDKVLDLCEKHDLYVILDLHSA